MSLANCTFVSPAGENDESNFTFDNSGTPIPLRGHLQEFVAQYDNEFGDISFGIKRYVPPGFPKQRRFFFHKIFRNVKRVMPEDARFYMSIKTAQGRCCK